MELQRSLQSFILKSSLDVSTGNGRTQIAVLKDVPVGCMALHPHCLSFLLSVGFFSTVHLGMCTHPLAVQLGSCRAVLGSLQGGWRGSRSVHLQMGSVGGLSHRAVGCASRCHPEPSQTGTSVEDVEDDWEAPRIAMVSCKPHTWGHCRVLGGTFSPSCRGSDDDGEEESAAQGSRQTHDNLYRVHMPSLYSCGSSYGSETSIPAAAHTVSNAPVTEYM